MSVYPSAAEQMTLVQQIDGRSWILRPEGLQGTVETLEGCPDYVDQDLLRHHPSAFYPGTQSCLLWLFGHLHMAAVPRLTHSAHWSLHLLLKRSLVSARRLYTCGLAAFSLFMPQMNCPVLPVLKLPHLPTSLCPGAQHPFLGGHSGALTL